MKHINLRYLYILQKKIIYSFLLLFLIFNSISNTYAEDLKKIEIYNDYYVDLFANGKIWFGQFVFIDGEYQLCQTIDCILYIEQQLEKELDLLNVSNKDDEIKIILLKKELSKINNYTRTDFQNAKKRLEEIESDFIKIHGLNSFEAGSFYAYLGAASMTNVAISSNEQTINYLVQSKNSYRGAIEKEFGVSEFDNLNWDLIIEDDTAWLGALDLMYDFQLAHAGLIGAYLGNNDKKFKNVRNEFISFVNSLPESLLLSYGNTDDFILNQIDAPLFNSYVTIDPDFAARYIDRLKNYCSRTLERRKEIADKYPGGTDICNKYHLNSAQLYNFTLDLNNKENIDVIKFHIAKQYESYDLIVDYEKFELIDLMSQVGMTDIMNIKDIFETGIILLSKIGSGPSDLKLAEYSLNYMSVLRIEETPEVFFENKNHLKFLKEVRAQYSPEYSESSISHLLPLDMMILEMELIMNPNKKKQSLEQMEQKLSLIRDNPHLSSDTNNQNYWIRNVYSWTLSTLLETYNFDKETGKLETLIDEALLFDDSNKSVLFDFRASVCKEKKDYHCAIDYREKYISDLELKLEEQKIYNLNNNISNQELFISGQTRLITSYQELGEYNYEIEEYQTAIDYFHKSLSLLQLFKFADNENALDVSMFQLRTLETNISEMINWIIVLELSYFPGRAIPRTDIENLFQATQFLYTSNTSQAIQRMIDRATFEDNNLKTLVRAKQDIEQQISKTRQGFEAASQEQLNPEFAKNYGKEYISLKEELLRINKTLEENILFNSELVIQNIRSLDEIQKSLSDDEVLLIYYTKGNYPFAWCISKNEYYVYYIEDKEKIYNQVLSIRKSIDERAIRDIDFEYTSSENLYSLIIGPIENIIKNKKEIIIIADGPLQQIPFDILPDNGEFNDKKNNWLIKKYVIRNLPTLDLYFGNSKNINNRNNSNLTFLGIGDPILKKEKENKVNKSINDIIAKSDYLDKVFRDSKIADLSQLSMLPELPETSNELKKIASYFTESDVSLFLRETARENTIKNLNLKNYNIISFATHSLPAELENSLSEPGLVLSLPQTPSFNDDGILTVSEITNLDLNADLVVLSACNTALEGSRKENSLSGLAQSFIYSGAKSLILSHWPVESNSTVDLMTTTFEYWINDGLVLSQALQKSKIELMKDPAYQHPMFWSSFSLYGS